MSADTKKDLQDLGFNAMKLGAKHALEISHMSHVEVANDAGRCNIANGLKKLHERATKHFKEQNLDFDIVHASVEIDAGGSQARTGLRLGEKLRAVCNPKEDISSDDHPEEFYEILQGKNVTFPLYGLPDKKVNELSAYNLGKATSEDHYWHGIDKKQRAQVRELYVETKAAHAKAAKLGVLLPDVATIDQSVPSEVRAVGSVMKNMLEGKMPVIITDKPSLKELIESDTTTSKDFELDITRISIPQAVQNVKKMNSVIKIVCAPIPTRDELVAFMQQE